MSQGQMNGTKKAIPQTIAILHQNADFSSPSCLSVFSPLVINRCFPELFIPQQTRFLAFSAGRLHFTGSMIDPKICIKEIIK